MSESVCPFWVGYLLLNPLRKKLQNPETLLTPYVKPGMTVGDIGSAMGFFSLPMADMVGPSGRVVCVDIQSKMLKKLKKRAAKAGVDAVMEYRVCSRTSLHLETPGQPYDFLLASAVVHEVPDAKALFEESFRVLKPGGRLLLSEPAGHVSQATFDHEVFVAEESGFHVIKALSERRTLGVVLEKPA
ncbi:methyltransferase domain-containing protein [Desulfoluna spongiiphila]|uniref:Methyltransferase domain-containing protein n=1 Tax=Desulfoluna spongiiphila TaxID=419481 RepID=A0A1G5FGC5_9BACT|nr:methyltransferase domain-containing protein [Desulfoluna spongiiphila]SCY38164.1 Methyltransferase domain-containing protein [Desulfoluna spongiiphila]